MILLIVFGVLLALAAVLLLTAVRLTIDSEQEKYAVEWGKVVEGRFVPSMDDPSLKLRVFGWTKNWSLLKILTKPSKSREVRKGHQAAEPEKKEQRKKWRLDPKVILPLIRSFKVRRMYINLDTGNYCTNAMLAPFFTFLNLAGGDLHTNFMGKNECEIVIENRPIRILGAFIRSRAGRFSNLINSAS